MPTRRDALAVTAVALAGCLGDSSSGSGQTATQSPTNGTPTATNSPTATPTDSPTPTESPTPTDSPTPTPEPAAFELVEYSAPESVGVDETTTISATVQNTGEVAGEFEADVFTRTDPDDRYSQLGDDPVSVRVPAGESVEIALVEYDPRYIDETLEVRLGDFDPITVPVVAARLPFGNEFERPDGYVIRVGEPELTRSYTTENFSGERVEEPAGDGQQWAFAPVRVENATGAAKLSPLASDFVVVARDRQYSSEFLVDEPVDRSLYEGGELQPTVVREGEVAFVVPESVAVADLQIVHTHDTFEGQVTAMWMSASDAGSRSIWRSLVRMFE